MVGGVELRVLGPLDVRVDGSSIPLGGARQRAVLGLLLCEPGKVVAQDRIVEVIWGPEAGDKTGGTVQVYVSNLRRALQPAADRFGAPIIATSRPGYRADVPESTLDLCSFHALVAEADQAEHRGDPDAAVALLRRANGLWRGPALADSQAFTGSVSLILDTARVTVLERVAMLELELGRHREVLDELNGWVAQHPLNEALRRHLMLALYRSGRQADALRSYQECRERLVDELGIEPSRELRDLEAAILDQAPVLETRESPRRRPGPHDAAYDRSTVIGTELARPAACLIVDGVTIDLDRRVTTVGRHPERDVVVLDPRASRDHARITRSAMGYRLEDGGSGNGTRVNGERVTSHDLAHGDVVRIGDTDLQFLLSSP